MPKLFLHGGGDLLPDALAGFAGVVGERVVALIALRTEADKLPIYRAQLQQRGLTRTIDIIVSAEQPLRRDLIAQDAVGGVFVCDGRAPDLHRALCGDQACVAWLRTSSAAYFGVGAGAQLAPNKAILGGWHARRELLHGKFAAPIIAVDASAGLDLLDVRSGLGLFDYSVDVRANRWGTLTRAVQALDLGLIDAAFAIDENTLLQVDDGKLSVHGVGQAYFVRPHPIGGMEVSICPPGTTLHTKMA